MDVMIMGIKSFTNNTGSALKVCLYVRAGVTPGCVRKCMVFTLIVNETKVITYGCDEDPFLDGIKVCQCSKGQSVCTKLRVTTRGSSVDKLLNTHSHLLLSLYCDSIIVSASH